MKNLNKKRNWNEINLVDLKYQSFKRRNYCIRNLDTDFSKLYIVAYNYDIEESFMPNTNFLLNKVSHSSKNFESSMNDFFLKNYLSDSENLIYKGSSVFDSLISLRQKLNFSYEIDEYDISEKKLCELEENLSDTDKKTIIKWLKIYGMPFLGNPNNNDTIGKTIIGPIPFFCGFTNDITTCKIHNSCICRLGCFLIALNSIYNTFYKHLIYLYKSDNNSSITLDIFKSNIEESNIEVLNRLDAYDVSDLKSNITSALLGTTINSVFNPNAILNDTTLPKLELYADTLISLAMYQLGIIISSPKIYSTNRCKCCNHLFLPTRKGNKYCPNCSRQKHWNKENLKK